MSEVDPTQEEYEAMRLALADALGDDAIDIKKCQGFVIAECAVINDTLAKTENPSPELLSQIEKQAPGQLKNTFDQQSSIATLISENKLDLTQEFKA